MQLPSSILAIAGAFPLRRVRRIAQKPSKPRATGTNPVPACVDQVAESIPHMPTNGSFAEDEISSMHNDDVMAAGMIGVILCLAFTVLLTLLISVNIWMLSVSP